MHGNYGTPTRGFTGSFLLFRTPQTSIFCAFQDLRPMKVPCSCAVNHSSHIAYRAIFEIFESSEAATLFIEWLELEVPSGTYAQESMKAQTVWAEDLLTSFDLS